MKGTVKLNATQVTAVKVGKSARKDEEAFGGLHHCIYCEDYNRAGRCCDPRGIFVNPQDKACKAFSYSSKSMGAEARGTYPWGNPGKRTCLVCGGKFQRTAGVPLCGRYGICYTHATELAQEGIISGNAPRVKEVETWKLA